MDSVFLELRIQKVNISTHLFYKELDEVTVLHEQFYKTKQNDFPHLLPGEFICKVYNTENI